ncbi:MAG: DUF3795 domain-containing protein [Bacteroidales bacterium]|nr:DUF3795 domain-containing protein [Bacteroidales bacterium]
MEPQTTAEAMLIAACGINCRSCMAWLRTRNRCNGCKATVGPKANHCSSCVIRNCPQLAASSKGLCFECNDFPCRRLRQLDKRYRLKYNENLIGNLQRIQHIGIDQFMAFQQLKWQCAHCGALLSVHRPNCKQCGKPRETAEG